jgi:hypothetical protein
MKLIEKTPSLPPVLNESQDHRLDDLFKSMLDIHWEICKYITEDLDMASPKLEKIAQESLRDIRGFKYAVRELLGDSHPVFTSEDPNYRGRYAKMLRGRRR